MLFKIRFDPVQMLDLQTLMEDFVDRAEHMGPALRMVVSVYLASQEEQFATKRDWAPLTFLTQQAKIRRGFPEMMVKTGTLRGSLTRRRGGQYASSYNNDRMALMGTRDPVAHLQALGTKERFDKGGHRTGAITARSMAFISPEQVTQFYQILENFLATGTVSATGPSLFAGLGV
jgi:hypothetical protein